MSLKQNDRFLWAEYCKNLFPMMFSVLGGTINALIDSILVSQKLGYEGLAAVNLSMPIYLILCTFGALVSSGAAIMSGSAAGEGKMAEAGECYRRALTLSLIIGAVLTAAGLVFADPISKLLTGGTELFEYVYGYSFVTFMGSLLTIISYIPLNFLQLDGKTRDITIMMIIMIVTDIALDILLMFIFPFGIYGAAAASIISSALACVYGFIRLSVGASDYRFGLAKISLKETLKVFRAGSPSALGNLADTVKLLALNTIILVTGGAQAAAVWAALNSLAEFSMTITSGVPLSAAPMTSVYYTARENGAIRILVKLQMISGVIFSAFFGIMLVLLRDVIKLTFSISSDLLIPLVCFGAFVLFDTVCSVWVMFFSATKRSKLSSVFVILRRLALPVIMAVVLSQTPLPIWLFLPLGAVFVIVVYFLTTMFISSRTKKTQRPLSAFLLFDDYLERENKVLDFSITPSDENICSASEQIKDFCAQNNMDKKQTMKLQLSIEELLGVLSQNVKKLETVDLRAFAAEDETGIRIRCAGKRFDPFEAAENDPNDEMLGVIMLKKMAKSVSFSYALGANTINIMFGK